MPRVLLLDTNFAAAPIYQHLVQCGHTVYVAGANPLDFLAKTCSTYIPLDYSDHEATRSVIKKNNIDIVVPGCNDVSYQTCSLLSEEMQLFGLDSPEVARTLNNKQKFRDFALTLGLPVPKVFLREELEDKNASLLTVIVKPVDGFSGRGMVVLQSNELHLLPQAIEQAQSFSVSKQCLIEQHVPGQLYSHTAFIKNKAIENDFIVEEHGTANPFVVDTSRVVFDFSQKILDSIRKCAEQIANALNLVDGLLHTQLIIHKEEFWLIEITRRCPGDLYSYLIHKSTGFDYVASYTQPFLNGWYKEDASKLTRAHIMRHTLTLPESRVLDFLQFSRPLWIDKYFPISAIGDAIRPSPFSRIGLLFAKTESEEELNSLFKTTLQRGLYQVQ